jgi:hypothetical protein
MNISSLGWIDFSSEHREKVRTVLDLLATPGVLDELGIGVVLVSFADRIFPGISTIQTRAKYFTLSRGKGNSSIICFVGNLKPKNSNKSPANW